MEKRGIAAAKGYAIGKVILKLQEESFVEDKVFEGVEVEQAKLQMAVELSKEQLQIIKQKTIDEIGEKESEVFDAHMMFLEDVEFVGKASLNIEKEKITATKAIIGVTQEYLDMFSAIEDEYLRERAVDIKDVSDRIVNNLTGKKMNTFEDMKDFSVIVAHDLTPSDTASLDKGKVIAFVTNIGGRTTHSAIMANVLGIPAVVGLVDITSMVKDGDDILVDGFTGMVIVNPSLEQIEEFKVKRENYLREKERLTKYKNLRTMTPTGKRITVAGNIGKPQDVESVIENGGEGIGLFRTEFLYMDKSSMPEEEEQFEAYKYVAVKMEGHPVVIRTLDIGGDKKLSYLPLEKEMNPFLGYRAIRLCLDRKDIFKVQLRAILRASHYGDINIMFPMISSLEEIFEAKEVVEECKEELRRENKAFNENIPVGIMIEIPSAAVMAEEFAKHVDFFSIGTNDLVQYTLAVDRMNEKVAHLYNPMHPAVLRLIKMTIDAAHKEGKWCGMCGEMAGNEECIRTLLGYGLDEFSMSAGSILRAKEVIIEG